MQHRLTFSAAYVCALCAGEHVGEVLHRAQLVATLGDDTLVEATYWFCDACLRAIEPNAGGLILRRSLSRWRSSLPSSIIEPR